MRCTLIVACLTVAAGCDPSVEEDTCDIDTDKLSVIVAAVDNGSTLRTEVEFSTPAADGTTPLAKCDSDQLTIDGADPELVERPDRVLYAATREMTGAAKVDVQLTRGGEVIALSVDLPPTFEVSAPVAGAEVSRSADLVLEWTPANPGGQMRIQLAEEIGAGVCLQTEVGAHDYKGLAGVDIEDDGNWRIPATVIDGGARDHCDATYRFTRVIGSPYPESLAEGGYLEGRVERLVPFVSVP